MYMHIGGWNKQVTAEIKLHTRLGRMTKKQLIEEGMRHDLNFEEKDTKANMVVALADEILDER